MTEDEIFDQLDDIYQSIDAMMTVGEFAMVDDVLRAVDVSERTPTLVLLGYASITSAAREHLRQRAAYMERLRAYLKAVDPENVDEVLAGFE